MTRTTPSRRITLHFLQIAFTEARTFIAPLLQATTAPCRRTLKAVLALRLRLPSPKWNVQSVQSAGGHG